VVFDIVLGGDWAGATFTEAGCPGTLADYVADPTNFASKLFLAMVYELIFNPLDANWAVNYVRIYQ
jgi:hypothetical protein